jgi:photosystem II stability/assembly factor-like uncharacterized protein
LRKSQLWVFLVSVLFASVAWTPRLLASPWLPFGPDGGDARRFAPDPHDPEHIYLGTANGWLYETHDGGQSWRRLSRIGKRDDLVLDGIFVDPANGKHIVVGAWVLGGNDGGVYITYDGGLTWISQAEMRGQSVLSLTSARSDPKILVAGTLKGVYRSTDGGQRWMLISPPDSTEIHNVQSVAIDPQDPSVIYAGTWHLPWKTTDAGENWSNIKKGIIDDSDVFSLIVDPDSPKVVYASACSGIYKSEDAGDGFRKLGTGMIPASSRRTRVLLQDPANLDVVFAGTTEGLFRSEDAGKDWSRTTDSNIIVNDVFVDSKDSQHVLLATDRGGVLASGDGGNTFHSSNRGFSARQITALKRDSQRPTTLYVGVVNDKEWGGVFQSDNGGVNWSQRSSGLDGLDVFSLGQAPDGTMIVGTVHGIFRLDSEGGVWKRVEDMPTVQNTETEQTAALVARPPVPVNRNQFVRRTGLSTASVQSAKKKLVGRRAKPRATTHSQRTTQASKAGGRGKVQLAAARNRRVDRKPAARVLTAVGGAASSLRNDDPSAVAGAALSGAKRFDGSVFALVTADNVVLAASSDGLLSSSDNGVSWQRTGPEDSADWRYLASAKRNVVAASLHAMEFSNDAGASWTPVKLPDALTQVAAISVEPSGEMWVGGREGVFVSSDDGLNWITPKNLFVNSVTSIYYDGPSNRIMVTATGAKDVAFLVQLPSKSVTFAQTGWNLRFMRPVGDHLVGATFFDGIVIQPRMVATPEPAETASR